MKYRENPQGLMETEGQKALGCLLEVKSLNKRRTYWL